MRNLVRKPLTWMILAECAVVAALVMVAWHLIATAAVPQVLMPPGVAPSVPAGQAMGPVATDPLAKSKSRDRTLLPGLNVDANFWRTRLAQLNRDQTAFEQLEWRLVHAAMDAAHRYVESVVIPSIARAERGGT
jgi:hypothetical protein